MAYLDGSAITTTRMGRCQYRSRLTPLDSCRALDASTSYGFLLHSGLIPFARLTVAPLLSVTTDTVLTPELLVL
jgi:hypothetical protein